MIAAIISPNSEAQGVVAKSLEHSGIADSLWSLTSYPDPEVLNDLPLKDSAGCLVFLDFTDIRAAVAIALQAAKMGPAVRTVVMLEQRSLEAELARMGLNHIIGLPPTENEVSSVLAQLNHGSDLHAGDSGGGGRVIAFLPGRPGAGATTLAVHTAAAVARISGQRTLLLDFDFRLGMTSFLLQLPGPHSVVDALNDIDRAGLRWDSMVNRRGMLDILGSAPDNLDESNLDRRTALLLTFARRRYHTVIIDLPGAMLDYEINVLRAASSCLLVCNSDIGVMHMAQRKAQRLRSLVLDEKTSVVLNCAGGLSMISARDLESILGLPVRFTVSHAYKEIAQATREGGTLSGRGGVTTQIESIARWMLPQFSSGAQETPEEETGARKFLEFITRGGTRAGGR